MEKGVLSMRLNFFRLKTRRHEFEDEHQPNTKIRLRGESGDRPHLAAPTGPAATSLKEPDTQWPSWLSSETTRVSDRALQTGQTSPVEHEESDEPTSLPAA
jgi:hypothetical protein